MPILAIETATPAGSVALVEKERVVVSRYFDVGHEHSRRLGGELEALLAIGRKEVGELAAVAVSIGPGSFTGLRIGLSAAKGLCLAGQVPLVAVPTLEVLAAGLPYASWSVGVVLAARRGEVYSALYQTSSGRPVLLESPMVSTPQELAAKWSGSQVLWMGDGVPQCAEFFGPEAQIVPPLWARPEARFVGWLAQDRLSVGNVADLASVEPEYLRDPDYVRAKGKRAKGAATAG